MGTKRNKKPVHGNQEEEKANRLIKYMCIVLVLLAILMIVAFSVM